eukprot:1924313-Pyramimonas_sp.AAC.1
MPWANQDAACRIAACRMPRPPKKPPDSFQTTFGGAPRSIREACGSSEKDSLWSPTPASYSFSSSSFCCPSSS